MTRKRLETLVVAAALLIVGGAYAPYLTNPFFGSDTWPWLASSRVQNPAEALRLAFSPIMPGTQFLDEVALFYHPLTSLTYAFDLALFGLSPSAMYATNLVLHLLAVVALYTFARGVGLSVWAGVLCALIQGLHPIAAATVPSLPRRQDMVVAAMLIASMSVLARARLGSDQPRWALVGSSLGLYFLALGGKEIAYAGLGVVPFVLACCWHGRTRLGQAALVLLGFGAVELLAFVVRWSVLGGLGGYYGSESVRGRFDGILEFFVRPYVTDVLWPVRIVMPERLRDWLLALLAVTAVLAVGVSAIRWRLRLVVLLGLVWQASFLALYVLVHTSLSAYLLYVPMAGLALMLGAVTQGGWELRQAQVGSWRTVRLGGAGLAAIGVAVLALATVPTSALLTSYSEWHDAGFVSDRFLAQAMPCLRSADGGTLEVHDLPHRIDYPTDQSRFVDAFMFEPYSLESAARVLAPGTRVTIEVRSVLDVRAPPKDIHVTCTPGPGRSVLTTRVVT